MKFLYKIMVLFFLIGSFEVYAFERYEDIYNYNIVFDLQNIYTEDLKDLVSLKCVCKSLNQILNIDKFLKQMHRRIIKSPIFAEQNSLKYLHCLNICVAANKKACTIDFKTIESDIYFKIDVIPSCKDCYKLSVLILNPGQAYEWPEIMETIAGLNRLLIVNLSIGTGTSYDRNELISGLKTYRNFLFEWAIRASDINTELSGHMIKFFEILVNKDIEKDSSIKIIEYIKVKTTCQKPEKKFGKRCIIS